MQSGSWNNSLSHTFQWICSIANRPPDLTKPHCDPANRCRPVCGTQTIVVQHLTNYRLTGQSILYQLQTGWLVSIMILIVPIADWLAVIYYNIDCNHCRPDGWNVLSQLQTEWPAVIVTIVNWMADNKCYSQGTNKPSSDSCSPWNFAPSHIYIICSEADHMTLT